MSEDLAQQEYFTSFDLGIDGGYYTRYMDKLHLKEQIASVPWHSQYPVHTAWDIGVRDSTAIVFFQKVGQAIHIIDYYENSDEGMEHYVDLIRSKPYIYGTHVAPHDIRVREQSDAARRWQKAFQLGITFEIAASISLMDGIEAVRTTLPRCWFDKRNCKRLITCLENYRKEYDSKRKIYSDKPARAQWNHAADAFRMLSVYLPKLRASMTPEDLQQIKHRAKYGTDNSSSFFGKR
jgi:phage terminase large subunit